jgi:hypothetical protein
MRKPKGGIRQPAGAQHRNMRDSAQCENYAGALALLKFSMKKFIAGFDFRR